MQKWKQNVLNKQELTMINWRKHKNIQNQFHSFYLEVSHSCLTTISCFNVVQKPLEFLSLRESENEIVSRFQINFLWKLFYQGPQSLSADFTWCPNPAESRDYVRLLRTTISPSELTKPQKFLQKFSLFSFAHAPTEDSTLWRQELPVASMITLKCVALE